jgi:DivIVA domain-containing protein
MLTAKDIERATFTATTLRRGYDQRQVDEFLDRVVSTLRHVEQVGVPDAAAGAWAVTAAEADRVSFTQTQVRGGYDEREVDEFLDRIVSTLRHYEQDADILRPASPVTTPPGLTPPSLPSPLETRATFVERLLRKLRGDP